MSFSFIYVIRKEILLILLLCFSFSFSIKQNNAFTIGTVDTVYGLVEYKIPNAKKWQKIKNGQNLDNIVEIRSYEKSSCKIRFDDNTIVYIGEKSRIKYRVISKSMVNKKPLYITAIKGSQYYHIKYSSTPNFLPSISTTNATFKSKNVGFNLSQSQDGSYSEITVLMGSLAINSPSKPGTTYIPAGKSTYLEDTKHISSPQKSTLEYIDNISSMFINVNKDLVREQNNIEKIRKIKTSKILNSSESIKTIIFKSFSVEGLFTGRWNVANGLPRMIIKKLENELTNIIVIDSTSNLTPEKLANAYGDGIYIMGYIDDFSLGKAQQISTSGNDIEEYVKIHLALSILLYDIKSGKLIKEYKFSRKIKGDINTQNNTSKLLVSPFTLDNSYLRESIVGKVLTELLDEITLSLIPHFM